MTEPTREQNDGYFGWCPRCRNQDGYLNVGRGQWSYCDEHKTRWWIGSNLFSSWRLKTEDEQRQRYEAKDFGSYKDVEPVYPPEIRSDA